MKLHEERFNGQRLTSLPEDHRVEWCQCDTCVAMMALLTDIPREALFDEYE